MSSSVKPFPTHPSILYIRLVASTNLGTFNAQRLLQDASHSRGIEHITIATRSLEGAATQRLAQTSNCAPKRCTNPRQSTQATASLSTRSCVASRSTSALDRTHSTPAHHLRHSNPHSASRTAHASFPAVSLCVPKIRFGIDGGERRDKLAT